jgi:hypothetical protein
MFVFANLDFVLKNTILGSYDGVVVAMEKLFRHTKFQALEYA